MAGHFDRMPGRYFTCSWFRNGKKEAEKITSNIAKLKMRLKNAKDMMLDGEFSAGDYKAMKFEIKRNWKK